MNPTYPDSDHDKSSIFSEDYITDHSFNSDFSEEFTDEEEEFDVNRYNRYAYYANQNTPAQVYLYQRYYQNYIYYQNYSNLCQIIWSSLNQLGNFESLGSGVSENQSSSSIRRTGTAKSIRENSGNSKTNLQETAEEQQLIEYLRQILIQADPVHTKIIQNYSTVEIIHGTVRYLNYLQELCNNLCR